MYDERKRFLKIPVVGGALTTLHSTLTILASKTMLMLGAETVNKDLNGVTLR
jgi:hypothetical protein